MTSAINSAIKAAAPAAGLLLLFLLDALSRVALALNSLRAIKESVRSPSTKVLVLRNFRRPKIIFSPLRATIFEKRSKDVVYHIHRDNTGNNFDPIAMRNFRQG